MVTLCSITRPAQTSLSEGKRSDSVHISSECSAWHTFSAGYHASQGGASGALLLLLSACQPLTCRLSHGINGAARCEHDLCCHGPVSIARYVSHLRPKCISSNLACGITCVDQARCWATMLGKHDVCLCRLDFASDCPTMHALEQALTI